jgi:hypothetical protein
MACAGTRELPDAPEPHLPPETNFVVQYGSTSLRYTRDAKDRHEHWADLGQQYMLMMTSWHSVRLLSAKTRAGLGGPFFPQWQQAIEQVGSGWSDGDGFIVNDILHPGQGSIYSYVWIQNDPRGRSLEFANTHEYWSSRLRAFAFSAAASTQFEIGPFSEATIGHVGAKPHTQGLSDFVLTPVGGFGMTVLQDWVDRRWVEPHESDWSPARVRTVRMLAAPGRSFANLLRLKAPWYRDSRSMSSR